MSEYRAKKKNNCLLASQSMLCKWLDDVCLYTENVYLSHAWRLLPIVFKKREGLVDPMVKLDAVSDRISFHPPL